MTNHYDVIKLFDQLRHKSKPLTQDEIAWVKQHLENPKANLDLDTFSFIYTYVLSVDPTPENLKLIERFLEPEVDDYVRRAALVCLIRYWDQLDKYQDIMIQLFEIIDDFDYSEIAIGLSGVIFDVIHKTKNKALISAVTDKFDYYLSKLPNDLEIEEESNLKMFAEAMHSRYNKYTFGEKWSGRLTDEEAIDVAKNYQKYLPK